MYSNNQSGYQQRNEGRQQTDQGGGGGGGNWNRNKTDYNNKFNSALGGGSNNDQNRGGFGGGKPFNNYNNSNQQRNFNTEGGDQQQGSNFRGGNKFQKDGKQFPQVIQILNEVALTENFTEGSLCLVWPKDQHQNQQQLQVQSYLEKVQIALCNETAVQIHTAEKVDQGMKLISGGVIQIENANYKLVKCFVLKNLTQEGQDATAFTIINAHNIYGFTIVITNPQQQNQIASQISAMVAHQQPIIKIKVQNVTIKNQICQRIVTVSNGDGENEYFLKFWEIQNQNIVLDQASTINFNTNITQWFTSKGIKFSPISTLEFIQINTNFLVAITFAKQPFYQQQQQQQKSPSQNTIYFFEVEIEQQRQIQALQKEIGPQESFIEKLTIVQNPLSNDNHIFAVLRQFSNRDDREDKKPQGYLYVVKNFSEAKELHQSNFPYTDIAITFGLTEGTIVIAQTQSIVPISWKLAKDEYQVKRFDNTLKNQGDIQNIYLFKSNLNLVEINQLLTVHYKGKNNPKKCITLSSLTLLEEKQKFDNSNNNNDQVGFQNRSQYPNSYQNRQQQQNTNTESGQRQQNFDGQRSQYQRNNNYNKPGYQGNRQNNYQQQ